MTIINEYRVRREIIRVTRIAANQGLIRSSNGNISFRLREDRFLIHSWRPEENGHGAG